MEHPFVVPKRYVPLPRKTCKKVSSVVVPTDVTVVSACVDYNKIPLGVVKENFFRYPNAYGHKFLVQRCETMNHFISVSRVVMENSSVVCVGVLREATF